MLKNFAKDTSRDELYPGIQCYQMPLEGIVEEAIHDGVIEDLLPSWAKFAEKPMKAKGLFVYILQAIFAGKTNSVELNIDYQLSEQGIVITQRRIAMMFLPDNTKIKSLAEIEKMAKEALPETKVVVLYGKTTTNRKAQALVNRTIKESPNKNILIISAKMAQRSFSIPEMTEVYLAYDNGSNGSTVQRLSRVLTPDGPTKVGRVFSLSFDPNRDDKFDALVLSSAINMKKKRGGKDIKEYVRKILKSVDIFKCTEDGPIQFDEAEFITACLHRNSVSRVIRTVCGHF